MSSLSETNHLSIVSLPKSSKNQARERISSISREQTGLILVSAHANQRMIERRITMRQILQVLRDGRQIGDIEWNTEVERGWKMRLQRITAGVEVVVIAKLVEHDNECVVVLTTFENS